MNIIIAIQIVLGRINQPSLLCVYILTVVAFFECVCINSTFLGRDSLLFFLIVGFYIFSAQLWYSAAICVKYCLILYHCVINNGYTFAMPGF